MRVHETIRARVATLTSDRSPSRDLFEITALIERGEVERACGRNVN